MWCRTFPITGNPLWAESKPWNRQANNHKLGQVSCLGRVHLRQPSATPGHSHRWQIYSWSCEFLISDSRLVLTSYIELSPEVAAWHAPDIDSALSVSTCRPSLFQYLKVHLEFLQFLLKEGDIYLAWPRCKDIWDTLVANPKASGYDKEVRGSRFCYVHFNLFKINSVRT